MAVEAASTSGSSTATAAVLFTKAEIGPTTSISSSMNRKPFFTRPNSRPSEASAPVCARPALSTNIAATVIVASLEKPESASTGVTRPSTSRLASTSIATTSTGSFSVTNRATAPTSTSSVRMASISIVRTS